MKIVPYEIGEELFEDAVIYEYGIDKLNLVKYENVGTVRKLQSAKMKRREEKGYNYIDLLTAFDIETTTISRTHEGFMYIWQFCLMDDVYVGRTWESFFDFLRELIEFFNVSLDRILVVYVHNLSFEFQFLKKFFKWKSIFATKKHEILKALTLNGIEFRCSYKLTNMSLYKMCQNSKSCIHKKQVGDLDYKIFRTPNTPLSLKEWSYVYGDVKGLVESLPDYMDGYTLATAPLTSTGFIRNECRKAMSKNPKNRKDFLAMRMSKEVYLMLKDALRGGNTHGSRFLAGRILKNVKSCDVASSYPYVQLTKEFPMSKFKLTKIYSDRNFNDKINNYCCIINCELVDVNIKSDVAVPYISISKCKTYSNVDKFNGRILSADRLSMIITEIDYKIIKSQYDCDFYVKEMYIAKKGLLPKEMREYILSRFVKKCVLKNGDIYLYIKSKNKLNAIFGMGCTDCVHDELTMDELITGQKTGEKELDIDKSLDSFYKNRNSFLTYAWGIWTTAHARAHLQKVVDLTSVNTVYVDTDSDKYINMPDGWLNDINREIIEEDERLGAYADVNGKRYYLGVFEEEEGYDFFITLGAKKYAYIQKGKDGRRHLGITVSGVSKDSGPKELKSLKNFKPGFVFKNAGGNKVWYNESDIHYLDIGDEHILTASNVGIAERTYELGVTEEFIENIGVNYLTLFN